MKIKTYEGACKALKLNPKALPIVSRLPERIGKSIVAFYKLSVIAKALNGDWKADFNNSEQYKYYPYFKFENNTFSCYGWSYDNDCNDGVSVHLLYKDSETATYAGKQFKKLYNDYLKK